MPNRTQKSAHEALQSLKEGNHRFRNGLKSIDHYPTPSKLKQLSEQGQNPFCVILGCADSRVPSESIFDQGLGDLFVLRVAGNVVAPSLLASIEFAIAKFNVPLIFVLGHAKCGAIKAAIEHDLAPLPQEKVSPNLKDLLGRLEPAVKNVKMRSHTTGEELEEECCIENIYESSRAIREQSEIVRAAMAEKKLIIAHGYFCLDTGEVKFEPQFRAN